MNTVYIILNVDVCIYFFSQGFWIQSQWKPYKKLSREGCGCFGRGEVLWVTLLQPIVSLYSTGTKRTQSAASVFSNMPRFFLLLFRIKFFFTGLGFASGLAATVTITHLLKAGDGIVCMDDVYGGETGLCSLDNLIRHYACTHSTWKMAVVLKEEAHCEYSDFLSCKAQIATSNELLRKLVWMCLSLTVRT